jgi:mercuric ion transport protein
LAIEAKSATRRAALFGIGGTVASFIAASCCGIPLVLASLGIGAGWLGGVGAIGGAYRLPLLAVGTISLASAAFLLWKMQRQASTCGPEGHCTPAAVRGALLAGIVIGTALLILAYTNA